MIQYNKSKEKAKRQRIERLLPEDASLLEREEVSHIIEVDMNQDGIEEWITIYRRGGKHYLLGVQNSEGKLKIIWNRGLRFKTIYHFQLTHLEHQGKSEIVIGGEIEGEEKNQLIIIECKDNEMTTFLNQYIAFDQMAIKDSNNTNERAEIVVSNDNNQRETIEIYRYSKGQLIRQYPPQDYLQQEQACREESLEETGDYLDYEDEKDIVLLKGLVAVLEEQEEDIFLFGKIDHTDRGYQQIYLMITSNGKTKNQMIKLVDECTQDYCMTVGRFLKGEKEQVFIKLRNREDTMGSKSFLLGSQHGKIVDYLKDYSFQNEIYAVDLELNQEFDIFIREIEANDMGMNEYIIRWLKGNEEGLEQACTLRGILQQ